MNNQVGEESLLSLPERHSRILALLQQHGSISVTQLAEMFKVSEVTIRKDLSYLESQKKLYRTHGSAILISPYISDRHVNEKEKRNVTEKRAIGAEAAKLLERDDSVIIASGTTVAFLAHEIKPVGRLTVITCGLTTTNLLEAALNGVMINSAQKVIVLADSSKFGRRGFSRICSLDSVDMIITDSGVQPHILKELRERGIEVRVVEV